VSDLHAGLYTILTTDETVAALVALRVYPGFAPADATVPYLVVKEITTQGHYHSTGIADIEDPMYQVECWAATSPDRATLKAAVRGALERRAGSIGSSYIRSLTLESSIDVIERREGGDEEADFGAIQTWSCWVKP